MAEQRKLPSQLQGAVSSRKGIKYTTAQLLTKKSRVELTLKLKSDIIDEAKKLGFKAVNPGESVSYFSCQIPTLPITIASYLHLGRACSPHWVFQGFVVLGLVSGGNGGWGGGGRWWDHPTMLATLGKMALGTSVGFLGIGRSN